MILNINYPNKDLSDKEPISLIGSFDDKNIFIPEYILIYKFLSKRNAHIDKIKLNLN